MNNSKRYACGLCRGAGVGTFYRVGRRPPTIEPHESCPRCGGRGWVRGRSKKRPPTIVITLPEFRLDLLAKAFGDCGRAAAGAAIAVREFSRAAGPLEGAAP